MANAKAETPDEVLVVAAILGDFDAFNDLVKRYRAAVVRTAQALVGPDDAEDRRPRPAPPTERPSPGVQRAFSLAPAS